MVREYVLISNTNALSQHLVRASGTADANFTANIRTKTDKVTLENGWGKIVFIFVRTNLKCFAEFLVIMSLVEAGVGCLT